MTRSQADIIYEFGGYIIVHSPRHDAYLIVTDDAPRYDSKTDAIAEVHRLVTARNDEGDGYDDDPLYVKRTPLSPEQKAQRDAEWEARQPGMREMLHGIFDYNDD